MIIGYARVSTEGQTLDAQLEALKAAGAETIYREKMSGTRGDRPQLRKMIAGLQAGDLVLLTRLDRLARSTRDLLNILAEISAQGAAFRSMHDPWADTTTPQGRLMVTFIGGIAEFERELIRDRTSEGRRRAKAAGRRMGRKPKLTATQKQEALAALADGSARGADLARRYNVAESTISRLRP